MTILVKKIGLAILLVAPLAGCSRDANLGPVANPEAAAAILGALTAGKAEGGDAAAAAATGTGWATIKGQFVFDGDAPQMKPYAVNKEHEICTVGGQAPPEETLVVSPGSKGIKNVVVFLRDAKRVHESANPKADPIEFDQKHCVFLTHVVGATVGQSLDIKNSDPTGHNTNIIGTFNQLIPSGGAIPFKVPKETAQPVKVVCSIHPWMTAWMLARKNGYFAITDADGKFEIANVPAGEALEFQVWHESGAAPGQGLVGTTADAPDLKWSNRGRVSVTVPENQVKEVKVVVPAKAFSL